MIFLQIAWSNLLRNQRRTLLTLFAVVFGIAVMVFTNGFNDGLSLQWANSLINESNGHIQIHHKEFYKFGISDMERIYTLHGLKLDFFTVIKNVCCRLYMLAMTHTLLRYEYDHN